MGRVNSLAHFVYGQDPSEWTEDVWIERVGQMAFVLERQTEVLAAGVCKGIAAAFAKAK